MCPVSPPQLPSVESGFPAPCAGTTSATGAGTTETDGTAFAGGILTGAGAVGGSSTDGTPLFGVKNGVRVVLGSGGVV